ncbi:hypothetical protein GS429_21035 [Natronorubrum sp. JWXQ-INN-674]|uniref:Uncharacterized protein n=1 Tax=Natronorubrum halalkaliphilum TaxID=2691917 RepID=A0A6B0VS98_9EURY|nr:hypothetical protein [Natronorubrum halalkaliphilum]MXV64510.1 hypothetical protein [Natronorubrum halalkaliphilum]
MTDNFDTPRTTRRSTLGTLGGGALGLGAAGIAGASEHDDDDHDHDTGDAFTMVDSGPNPDPLVDAAGQSLPEDPDPETELFDAEPEFPPFANVEEMAAEHDRGAVERYLIPHGDPNLLHSRRLVVWPNADEDGAATWGEFSGGSATARVEPAETGEGEARGRNRSAVHIEFEELYPDGVYTVWVVHEPGYHRPLGGNDGENNVFTADEDGSAVLETVDEPDELTLPPAVDGEEFPVTQSPLHEIPDEFFFVVAYHYDNRTWGPQPGPYWVPQLVINEREE